MTSIDNARVERLRPLWKSVAALCGLAAAVLPLAAMAQDAQAPEHKPPELHAVSLRGIVLLSAPDQLEKSGWHADPHGVDASRLPDLADVKSQQALSGLLGKPITAELLQALRAIIAKSLEAAHRPFASVIIPRQEAIGGVMQVVVLEARLGQVKVEGARYFTPDQYRAAVPIAPGGPIASDALAAAANTINANPYRHAAIVATPGEALGTTDLTIRAQDRLPVGGNVGIDNTGNAATSLVRLNTGIDWGNAFWQGDDLNAQLTASPDLYRMRQLSLTYASQLASGNAFSLSGNLADTHSAATGLVASTGRNANLSGRYTIALPALGPISEHLSLGYDFKSTNNNVLFGGASVFPSTTDIDQFVAGIDASAPDSSGNSHANLMLFVSPGGFDSRNGDAAFASQQAGARARYAYARLTLDRLTALPAGMAWHAALTAQLSSGILLPSEQLGFGGEQSIRGFVTQGEARDQGVILQNELRAPPMVTGIGRLLGLGDGKDQLTPFVFIDAGIGANHQDFAGKPSTDIKMASVGPGLAWQVAPNANARFSLGEPILRKGSTGPLLGPQFGMQVGF